MLDLSEIAAAEKHANTVAAPMNAVLTILGTERVLNNKLNHLLKVLLFKPTVVGTNLGSIAKVSCTKGPMHAPLSAAKQSSMQKRAILFEVAKIEMYIKIPKIPATGPPKPVARKNETPAAPESIAKKSFLYTSVQYKRKGVGF